MRISLNLASRPYVELRPVYKRLRVLIAMLAVFAIAFWYVLRTEYARASEARARVDAIQDSVARLRSEQRRDQAEMQQPREAGVLRQSQFLNNLFLEKAFSWTAVMMDLERVLPAGVQVTNIDPQVAKDGHVTVRLRVQGQHDKAVDLMRNLERSRRFIAPRLTGESAETNASDNRNPSFQNAVAGNGVNFEILADYNPLPPKPEKESEKKGPENKSGTREVKTTAPVKHSSSASSKPAIPAGPSRGGRH